MKRQKFKGQVEEFLRQNPGSTQLEISRALPTRSPDYGNHKYVASAVVSLRREGKIADVERCEHCNAAQSRGNQNAKLFLL